MRKTWRILLDTNVVLDVLLEREPWLTDARAIWEAVDEGRVRAHLPASVLTDIYYVATRLTNPSKARETVQVCLDAFEFCTVDQHLLEQAHQLSGSDFEDNVQIACAVRDGLEAIVTRDSEGFKTSSLSVWSPQYFRTLLEADVQ